MNQSHISSMVRIISKANSEVQNSLYKVLSDKDLDYYDAVPLANAIGNDLLAVIEVADYLREKTVGNVVTFITNQNINFTNICYVGCKFCGFSRTPKQKDAYFLDETMVVEKAKQAWQLGAREVCIQGGLPKDFDGNYYRKIVSAIKKELPEIHIHAFSPMEIDYGVEKTGMPLKDYLRMLKEAGLDSIPGTAAEILDDRIRSLLSPVKLTAKRWEEIIRTAHEVGFRTSATMMYGHVEEVEDWIRHMLLIREIQKDTGGFTEFVPLGFIHENTAIYKLNKARQGATEGEHLKVHALARILLYRYINNIQVSWVKMGPELAARCLKAGANDFGGTLREENISKMAGAKYGEYLAAEEIIRYIEKVGRTPALRSTTYDEISSVVTV